MKAVLYFPLAYLANVHGFILLVPYLVVFLTVVRMVQVRQLAKFEERNSNGETNILRTMPIVVR